MATLRALVSFHAPGRFVAADEEVDSADPVVTGRDALFGPAEEAEEAAPKDGAPAKPRRSAKKAAPK